ncbi:hypothetical protein [Caldanaerobacter subterraneus]|uniref:Uncharacterized protein n=1 Tax=Caldanaerobacter subterraneus TaxID=911092 RepID=A0A4R2JAY2_9THEO|nr:hypothetical protein [Caldanaerobacter subterraneus]TCO55497.1 hypothetical protein EV203_1393 [Caldanaerobacter subterraneus]
MRKINAVNKNVSSSYLKNKDKVEIRNALYDLIKGLELSDKIEILEKIKIESRLFREFYEHKLNHGFLFYVTSNFLEAINTFFVTLVGVLVGFIGGTINTVINSKTTNLLSKDFIQKINHMVNAFVNEVTSIKFIVTILSIILIIIFVISLLVVYPEKRKISHLIGIYSYWEYYSNYLQVKIKNIQQKTK